MSVKFMVVFSSLFIKILFFVEHIIAVFCNFFLLINSVQLGDAWSMWEVGPLHQGWLIQQTLISMTGV